MSIRIPAAGLKEECASRSDQSPAAGWNTAPSQQPRFQATRSPAVIKANLGTLIHGNIISNRSLDQKIGRLKERFSAYATCYPFGLWAPGLIISNEMRALTETYLPFPEIRQALHAFLAFSLRFPPALDSLHLPLETTWLDFLQRTAGAGPPVNPALLLKRLCYDERFRELFLFTLFLPKHHGGSFNRYPTQLSFVKEWLTEHIRSTSTSIRCLDAACGTGEGTYDLALLLGNSGISTNQYLIEGCSLDPLEVFAAAHGVFPHDKKRQTAYCHSTAQLFISGSPCQIWFFRDDICRQPQANETQYLIILCNGLLGGPMLHDRLHLQRAVQALAARLEDGGLLLIADHFHGGWKKNTPRQVLVELLQHYGLQVRNLDGSIVAVKEKRDRH